jgi:hypothetical protein
MFGSTGSNIGGKVFAMLGKGKLVVKLPRERVETMVSSGRSEPFDPGQGRLMKKWAAVAATAGDANSPSWASTPVWPPSTLPASTSWFDKAQIRQRQHLLVQGD